MTSIYVTGVVGFMLGLFVGATLREAVAIGRTGHTVIARAAWRKVDGALHRPSARYVGAALVALALMANLAVGFLSISTRSAQEEATQRQTSLLACTARYRALEGAARDERAAAYAAANDASRRLWRALSKRLEAGSGTQDVVALITAYLGDLRKIDSTRVENPYPPPDLCIAYEEPTP